MFKMGKEEKGRLGTESKKEEKEHLRMKIKGDSTVRGV